MPRTSRRALGCTSTAELGRRAHARPEPEDGGAPRGPSFFYWSSSGRGPHTSSSQLRPAAAHPHHRAEPVPNCGTAGRDKPQHAHAVAFRRTNSPGFEWVDDRRLGYSCPIPGGWRQAIGAHASERRKTIDLFANDSSSKSLYRGHMRIDQLSNSDRGHHAAAVGRPRMTRSGTETFPGHHGEHSAVLSPGLPLIRAPSACAAEHRVVRRGQEVSRPPAPPPAAHGAPTGMIRRVT